MTKSLKRDKEFTEITERAHKYRKKMRELWDEEFGLYLNRLTKNQKLSRRISPTNFYALNAKAATQPQAKRMIDEHFYNPDEFWGDYIMPSCARNDTAYTGETYWRGSIWAPMNLLVYWGMQNYHIPGAKKDLAEKSKDLLLKNWLEKGWIRENYNAETGSYNGRSEHFYHWGALLGMIYLVETGYLKE
jgi:putative isomerase